MEGKMPYKGTPEEIAEKKRKYYLANKEKLNQKNREWRKENIERDRELKKLYAQKNKEKIAEYQAKWREENKETILEYRKEYYQDNKEEIRQKTKDWQRANPEKHKQKVKRYRSTEKGKITRAAEKAVFRACLKESTPPWVNRKELREIYKACRLLNNSLGGNAYHVDHKIPLRGENVCGLHVPWNLQIIKKEENLKKTNKLHKEYSGEENLL